MALELHAKTYYDIPRLRGAGDEHTFVIHFSSRNPNLVYHGTSWGSVEQGIFEGEPVPLPHLLPVFDDQSMFGGTLYINITLRFLAVREVPELEGAYLSMNTKVPYWFRAPSGNYTATWDAELKGSPYRIVRVTV